MVSATIGGSPETFTDSGRVINTGGFDLASCPNGTNESTQWTPIGNAGCPGAVLNLTPSSQSLDLTQSANVTANLTNSCGNALQNATVDFSVLTGPNAGLSGNSATDSSGNAGFGYSSTLTGTDTVQASVTNIAGTFYSNQVTVIWSKDGTTLTVDNGTADYHDSTTLTATLKDSHGTPLSGQSITFTVGTQTCGPVTTNGSGVASCSFTPTQAAGSYTLSASYSGSSVYLGATGTATFVITHEETTTKYTGPSAALLGGSVTLSGNLKEDGTTPISGRTLTLAIGTQSCTGTTNGSGNASCTISPVTEALGPRPSARRLPATPTTCRRVPARPPTCSRMPARAASWSAISRPRARAR